MRPALWFVAGVLLTLWVIYSPTADAQSVQLMFGSFGGTATAVQLTTDGYLRVQIN